MEPSGPGPDREDFGEASLSDAQSSNPPDDPEMIEPDADPLDTDVEDADLFLGLDDEEEDGEGVEEDLSTP
jgi:hypothetical protein